MKEITFPYDNKVYQALVKVKDLTDKSPELEENILLREYNYQLLDAASQYT